MFLLNGNTLPQGTPFKDAEGNQYPQNWLNLSTAEEKSAIGITEVADPVRADDRFYWNGDIAYPKTLEDVTETIDGKEHTTKGLKSNFIAQIKTTAGSLLSVTDWKVIRAAEGGLAVDADITSKRTAIRTKSNELESAITACTTVEQLASLNLSFKIEE
jgi:hypothetical protein